MLATTLKRLLLGLHLFALALGASSASGSRLGSTPEASTPPFNELSVAVEYYHPGFDHYFLTADPLEIEALSSGKFKGWVRTGEKFAVLPPDSAVAESTPVCRFYAPGIGSHFYSGIPSECQDVLEQFSNSWILESEDVYRAFLPDAAGSCPSGTQPVYRLWNHRTDVNHRYTTNPDLAGMMMKRKGYIAEGFGQALSIPVALCAPVGVACALVASSPTPIVGSALTLAAMCTGEPTTYVWSGCDSSSDTCATTSSDAGIKTYGVVATGPWGAGEPAAIAIDWKPVGTTVDGGAPSCTISASNTAPAVGSSITLSVLCTVIPTSYTWTGCTSSASTCATTSAIAGAVTYSVAATTPAGKASPASITINWQGTSTSTPPPPPPSSTPTPTPAPTPSATPSPNVRTAIASIPSGEARVISSNAIIDVWQGPQPAGGGNIDLAVAAWNSGIFAPALGANGSIVFAGGGDGDYWGTDAYAFDLASGLWRRIKDRTNALSWNPTIDYALPASDPRHFDRTYAEHGDGTPGAPHTYDLVTYVPPEAVGGKGALVYPVTRYAYAQISSNWAHKLTLDQPTWSRASTAPVAANMNYLGMADYDPTSKRVWILAATGSGAYNDTIQYLDFSDGSGVGVPGSVSLGKDYLIYSGTMRFWRGTDGTKRYLVWLSYDPRSRLNLIDLDAPQTGVHPLNVASPPTNFGYPNSGFALGRTIGFALHPTPDQDGSQIYQITPPADALGGVWTVTAKRLAGITLGAAQNNGLWKRLEWHEALGVATFFISARGPVYAYRPGTATTPTPAPTPAPTPTPAPSPTTGTTTQPALAGSLKLSVQTVPYAGVGLALATSKNLGFVRLGNRWYKCAGDHRRIDANTPDEQGGRQEIISLNVPANDWREDQPHYVRSGMGLGDVQIALPDDGFCVARNDEIWSFVSARVVGRSTVDQTTWARANYGADIVTQDMEHIGAWSLTTKRWRSILPRPQEMLGDTAWFGLYDSAKDQFIIPLASSFLFISGAGVDVSPRFGASQSLMTYGNFDFHASGIVQDGRTAYVYDQAHGALYSLNLDSSPFALTKVLDLPELTYASAGRGVYLVWHPELRAVVISGINGKMYAFEVDTRKLTKWDRPDGFVNSNGALVPALELFYDPDTKDIVSIGGIDWDTGMTSSVYWRLHLSQ